ncbi:MAG: AlpA family phage regulatory protein [Gammaproteobacteria bacterium]|nr:AlpA family phage regulatory protein [Gammaproteobacteria bacterium]
MNIERILREPNVTEARGISRSTLWAETKKGLFPRPVRIGPRSVGWPASEVAAINRAIIGGKSEAEIRELVQRLESARQAAA